MHSLPFNPFTIDFALRNLVEASAGTGKTYSITNLYLRLLLEEKLDVSAIAVVTFTESATAELRTRIRRRISETLHALDNPESADDDIRRLLSLASPEDARLRLTYARTSFDRAAIHTIHSFCMRIMKENAFESSALFDAALSRETDQIMDDAARAYCRNLITRSGPLAFSAINFEELCETIQKCFITAESHAPDASLLLPSGDPTAAEPALLKAFSAALDAVTPFLPVSDSLEAAVAACGFGNAKLSPRVMQTALEVISPADGTLCFDTDALSVFLKSTKNLCATIEETGLSEKYHTTIRDRLDALTGDAEGFVRAMTALRAAAGAILGFPSRFCALAAREFCATAGESISRAKNERRIWFFSDLIDSLFRAVMTNRESLARAVAQRYRIALIDEFQDTDPRQYQIFSALFPRLVYIGDPKQSIYRFRGADIHSYLEASEKSAARHTLTVNYRSHPSLISAVNAIFSGSDPFVLPGIGYTPVQAGLSFAGITGDSGRSEFNIRHFSAANAELAGKSATDFTVREISRLLAAGAMIDTGKGARPVNAGDIAILVTRNDEAYAVWRALQNTGIPASIRTERSVLDSEEYGDFNILLHALAQPGNVAFIKAALATPLIGYPFVRIAALDDASLMAMRERFDGYRHTALRRGILAAYRRITADFAAYERLLATNGGERRAANYDHLAELADAHLRERSLSLDSLLGDSPLRGTLPGEAAELRIARDDEGVQILTVHRSKGLEFPVVFVPFSWRAQKPLRAGLNAVPFRDSSRRGMYFTDNGNDLAPQVLQELRRETESESRRLLYVALTRAKARCYLLHASVDSSDDAMPALAGLLGCTDNDPAQLDASLSALSAAHGITLIEEAEPLREKPGSGMLAIASSADMLVGARPLPAPLRSFSVMSFSSLTATHTSEQPDRDDDASTAPAATAETVPSLPPGAATGIMLHAVFETLDFAAGPDPDSIARELLRAGLPLSRIPDVSALVKRVIEVPAHDSLGFSLGDIDLNRSVRELDFCFPATAEITELDAALAADAPHLYEAGRLNARRLNGFLKGFIDMIFQHDDRYYVLDWKSNWLGSEPDHYSPERMFREMKRHHYALQGAIYSAAVDALLCSRVPGYSYERDFGGYLYVFVRGCGFGPSSVLHKPGIELLRRINPRGGRQ